MKFFTDALENTKKLHNGNELNTEVATLYNNFAIIYDKMNDYEQAVEFYLKDMKICIDLFGEDNELVAK